MKTVKIELEITYDENKSSFPKDWDWNVILGVEGEETVKVINCDPFFEVLDLLELDQEVWFMPNKYLGIKCKILGISFYVGIGNEKWIFINKLNTNLENEKNKKLAYNAMKNGSIIFYSIDEPLGHSITADQIYENMNEVLENIETDPGKAQVMSLNAWRESINKTIKEIKKLGIQFEVNYKEKIKGVDWVNFEDLPLAKLFSCKEPRVEG